MSEMTLTELKRQIDEIVEWAENNGSRANDIHVFILKYDGGLTEDIELKLTLGSHKRVYIDPK